MAVVNYIQILYLCILKQPWRKYKMEHLSCELHSNLVSLHSETTSSRNAKTHGTLWITFKSCIFAFWNNILLKSHHSAFVVNYIQILYLCILKQPDNIVSIKQTSCELHSNLVSLHSETTHSWVTETAQELWITFKSCIFAFWNNN